jgi:ADP-ribose pyrophosphatase
MGYIPEHAKKVFEGIIFDVYHWDQEQFDGTTKTFEGIRHLSSASVIPVVGDRIYIQKEEQPGEDAKYGFPAGRFERHEHDPIEVGERELLEETGYKGGNIELYKKLESNRGKMEWVHYILIARDCVKIAEPNLDPGERIHDTKLVSFEELLEWSKHEDFIAGALKEDLAQAVADETFREEFRKKIFGVY